MSERDGFEVKWITGVQEDADGNFMVRVQWKGYKQQSWLQLKHAIGARWSLDKFVERFERAIESAENGDDDANADDNDVSSSSSTTPEPCASTSKAAKTQRRAVPLKKKKLIQKKIPEKLFKKGPCSGAKKSL